MSQKMHVAIIEDDKDYARALQPLLKKNNWDVDFFYSTTDFGQTKLDQYDVIISDLSLEPINGRQLLDTISKKTSAELFLMNEGGFDSTDLSNNYIKGLIDKNNPHDIVDKLEYVNTKLRIQKLAVVERENLVGINSSHAYTVDSKEDLLIIEIKDSSTEAIYKIRQLIEFINKNVIVSFSDSITMDSSDFGSLASFFNVLSKKNKKLVYWNKTSSIKTKDVFEVSQLEKLIPIFNDIDQAISYLKSC